MSKVLKEIESITKSNKILVAFKDDEGKIKVMAKNVNTSEAFEMLTEAQEKLFEITEA